MHSMRVLFMERRYAKFDAASVRLLRDAARRCQRCILRAMSRSKSVDSYIVRDDELSIHKAALGFLVYRAHR
jgi:hypothetical protein